MTIHSRIATDFAAPEVPRATLPDSQMSTISLAGLAVPVMKGGFMTAIVPIHRCPPLQQKIPI